MEHSNQYAYYVIEHTMYIQRGRFCLVEEGSRWYHRLSPPVANLTFTVTLNYFADVLILWSLQLPLVRKINKRKFYILWRTGNPQKQATRCFMIWRLNITHSRHPKCVYLAVCLKCNLPGEKDGLYMLVLLASPRWRWCLGDILVPYRISCCMKPTNIRPDTGAT